jgi:lysophospholipase L1-like esterase
MKGNNLGSVRRQLANIANQVDSIGEVIYGNATYVAQGNLFQAYTSAVSAAPSSTIKGYETRFSYLDEAIKAVSIYFNLENAGVQVKCQLKKDDQTVLDTVYKTISSAGWQEALFVFSRVFNSADFGSGNLRVSLEVVGTTNGRMHKGTITATARVTAEASGINSNRYNTTANETFVNSTVNGATLAVTFLGENNLVIQKPALVVAQDTQNWYKELSLPPKIYGVVGKEVNIYFDNIISDNMRKYWFNVTCAVGTQQDERWTCTPTAAGTSTLTIDVYDDMDNLVKTATTSIIVVAADAQTGVTKTALFVGDSTTAAGTYTGELLTLLGASDPMNITLIGTQGSSTNLHEGYGGWTVADHYSSVSSPFVFSTVYNFATYMATHGFAAVDWIFTHLGINDVFGALNDASVDGTITANLAAFEAMITSQKAFNANVKIGIMLPILPSLQQNAFGKNYDNGQTQRRYKRNIHRYTKALITAFGGREAANIYLIPTNVNIDTANNMQTETVAVNSRNAVEVVRQSNGVHPAAAGYYQMADSVYYALKNIT